MAERDVVVRPDLAGDGAGAELVLRVGVGVEEVDDERLASRLGQRQRRRPHRAFVERRAHRSVGHDALGHLAAQLARDERLEGAEHAVGFGSGAPAEFQDVAEAFAW